MEALVEDLVHEAEVGAVERGVHLDVPAEEGERVARPRMSAGGAAEASIESPTRSTRSPSTASPTSPSIGSTGTAVVAGGGVVGGGGGGGSVG